MNHEHFMRIALQEAEENKSNGGYGVGAIVVKDNEVIATGQNSILEYNDPTAHAEVVAIRSASQKLKTENLSGCWLYSTYEPCAMCASAAVWARMKGIVFSARCDDSTNAHSLRVKLRAQDILSVSTPKLELIPDVLRSKGLRFMDFVPCTHKSCS